MRPTEFPAEAIVAAGQSLQAAGRNVTGFALRQRVGGGNPARLRQVWDEYLASNTTAQAQPLAELPVEVADEVAAVTAALKERITTLAVELNDKAVKAAERRVAEVVRAAGEQREQAERELADATSTVDDLEKTLDATRSEVEALGGKLAESQAHGQAQAVELAQLRERLTAAEQAIRSDAEAFERLRTELAQARSEAQAAREDAARLRGQVEALEGQRAELVKVLAERPVAVSQAQKPASKG